MSFISTIKSNYKSGNIVEKLIYINIALFVFTLLINVFQGLYKGEINWLIEWFSLDDNYNSLLTKPWTILSYGFLHGGFFHILFNLIALYFMGNLFIEYFTQKQLLTFYLLGTFFGGLLFIVSKNYFPLFEGKSYYLVGASAGISAIFVGIATYLPNYQIKLPLIGFVKLWHITTIWIILNILGFDGNNAGGNFSHIGGALFGFFYINQASNKQIDILSKFLALFKQKEKPLKTVYKSKKKTKSSVKNTTENQQEIDKILDKIGKSGYDALSKQEKEFLFKQGKK